MKDLTASLASRIALGLLTGALTFAVLAAVVWFAEIRATERTIATLREDYEICDNIDPVVWECTVVSERMILMPKGQRP